MPSRVLLPAALAASAALGLVLTWLLTYRLEPTSWADRGVQRGFTGLGDTPAGGLAERAAHLVDPRPFALMAAGLILVALLRRRVRLAVAAGAILGGANLTTQVLQRLTAEPRAFDLAVWRGGMGEELWPSGHTTAVMTLVLCLVLVSPQRLRPFAAAAGALFAVVVVYSILVLGWHLPSDVVGGFLVASGWALAVTALLHVAEERWPSPARRDPRLRLTAVIGPPAAAAGLSVLTVAALVLTRPRYAIDHAVDHSAFVVGAPLLAAAALALSTAVVAVLRR